MGTGLSLLYAPKSGKEFREKIGEMTDDAVDKVKNYATEAQEKIKSTIEDSKGSNQGENGSYHLGHRGR